MSLTDKNIVITPNIGQSADPKIVFSGADSTTAAQDISLSVYPTSNGTLSFDGSAGQLFSITNSLSGSIFSVNDVSGIPSIEVLDSGVVKLAEYGGNVGIGVGTPGEKLEVSGNVKISGTTEILTKTSTIDGWTYAGKNISVNTQETVPRGISFSTDGTKMYIVGQTTDTVYQYTLSTPYDVSTATYASKSVSILAQDTASSSLFFSTDGTAFYMLGDTNDTVYQYTMSTAWDVSTATYATKSFSVTAQETAPQGLEISPDGTKMYVIGSTNDTVYQYTLSTAWDVSTATYASKSFSVQAFEGSQAGIEFNNDGTKMYVVGVGFDCILEYTLSTAWDVSTAVFTDRILVSLGNSVINPLAIYDANTPTDIYTDFTNNIAYVLDANTNRVYQYSINTTPLKIAGNKLVISPFTYFKNDIATLGSIRALGAIQATNAALFSSTLNVGGTLTASGTLAAASTITLGGATTSTTTIGTSATTGTTIIGGTSQTGQIIVGQSTVSQTLNFGIGATIAANTKTVNIGINGVASSITNVNIGNSSGTSTVTVGSTVQAATVNLATGVNASGVTKTVNIGTNGASGSITNINIGSAFAGANGNTYFNQPLEINNGLTVRRTATQFLTIKNDNVTVSPFISSYTANNNAKQLYFDCSTLDLTAPTGGYLGYVFRVNEVPAFSINTSGSSIFTNNSSGSAVRITQTGTGAALTVEDETNPDSTPFVIDAAGNVGIGTSSPAYKLDVIGNISAGDSNNTRGIRLGQIGFQAALLYNGGNGNLDISPRSGYATTFKASESGSEYMRIDSAGNVGIGTSSPGAKLTIAGGVLPTPGAGNIGMSSQLTTGRTGTYDAGTLASISNNLDSSSLELSVGSTSGYETGISLTGKYTTNYQGVMRFLTSSTERMRIDSAGNLIVGGTSAVSPITISNTAANDAATCGLSLLRYGTTYGSSVFHNYNSALNDESLHLSVSPNTSGNPANNSLTKYMLTGNGTHIWYGATTSTERMRIDSSGNVGIGNTPSGTYKLEVTGAIGCSTTINATTGYKVAGAATSGQYLRGNGTNFVSSAIQAADIPTLNQNTTGSANELLAKYAYLSGAGSIGDTTTAVTLSPGLGSTTVAMHTSHGYFGSYATTLTMSGYERYGAYQISGNYNASTPALAIRNYNQDLAGWTSWTPVLTSANYTSYSPSLTGGGASGTWGISVSGSSTSCTGNAATATNATNASYLNGTAQTSLFIGKVCSTVDINAANDTGSISVRGDATYPASMSFNRSGVYAINVGLSNQNNFVIGGWSASANAFSMTGAGALTMLNNITAYSDERLKKNWRDLPINFVERLADIKHGIYDRTDQECTQVGVSAQSLQPLLPDAIMTQVDGMLSVSYGNAALVSAVQLAKEVVLLKEQSSMQSNTIKLLIETVKEQQIQIDELKELINKGK